MGEIPLDVGIAPAGGACLVTELQSCRRICAIIVQSTLEVFSYGDQAKKAAQGTGGP